MATKMKNMLLSIICFLFFLEVLFRPCWSYQLFLGCTTVTDVNDFLVIMSCNDQTYSLVLVEDGKIGSQFRDRKTKALKHKKIHFHSNSKLSHIDWEVFLLNQQNARLELDEIKFSSNPNLVMDVIDASSRISIHKLSVIDQDGVKSVNLFSSGGIWEMRFHVAFVNGTSFNSKFQYGRDPSRTIRSLSIYGDEVDENWYDLNQFLPAILTAGISRRTLQSLRLRNLRLLNSNWDPSVFIKETPALKVLVMDNCTGGFIFQSDFIKTILGPSYVEECESVDDLPMDHLKLDFAVDKWVLFEEGSLGENCPQSKRLNGARVGKDMIKAWNRTSPYQCKVPDNSKQDNTKDGACRLCILNRRDGSAYIPRGMLDCTDWSRMSHSTPLLVNSISKQFSFLLLFVLRRLFTF